MNENYVIINDKKVEFDGEKNLLEVIRGANIELPTFCYHSSLSVYGACRLCIVEIDGMGTVTSCSTQPRPGMVIRTHTNSLRKMRKIYLELLLANHHQTCTTCQKSSMCRLQDLAARLGVSEVRFASTDRDKPLDKSNPSLERDPNKCILCGDCVRACHEIQGIGAIDFSKRGAATEVAPAFGRELKHVDCVYCGQCAAVCPTGAIVPKSDLEKVWTALNDPTKHVVAQIAPAIRVSIGEMFGLEPGTVLTGKIVAALKMLGFDRVFDTSFAADLTVLEETNEFLKRKAENKPLPLFTSCCPAWVKTAEQYYADLLPNVSTCRSPQQMFGAVARETIKEEGKELYVVSIMPCTAKKFEAQRPEFATDGKPDIDAVLTTQELGRMVKQAGIGFKELAPESLDMPLGFKTGAGVIFGVTGGVSEAVLRYAAEKVTGRKLDNCDFVDVRGDEGIRVRAVRVGDTELKLAVVHGLKNARAVAEQVRGGQCDYDFIEVMACPGGCIAGAGQPVSFDPDCRAKRTRGIYETDKTLQLHKSQDNPYLKKCCEETLGDIGGHKTHELLHTEYKSRRRLDDDGFAILENGGPKKVEVCVCVGTSCYVRGSQKLLERIMDFIKSGGLEGEVDVRASFCFEACDRGPTVKIGPTVLHKCGFEAVKAELMKQVNLSKV